MYKYHSCISPVAIIILHHIHPEGDQGSPHRRQIVLAIQQRHPYLYTYLIHLHVKIQTEEYSPDRLYYHKYSEEAHEHFHGAGRGAAHGSGCSRAVGFIHPPGTLLVRLQMICLQVA